LATLAAFALDDTVGSPASSRTAPPVAPTGMVGAARESAPPVFERSAYRPSAGSRPIAFLASASAILAMAAALGTLNMVSGHKDRHRLTVVEMRDLDVTPPPPPPEPTKLETPPAAVTQTVAPKPLIELPSQGPTQVMVDAPPPPAPPFVTSEGVKPTAAPAPAPAPATTMEGGDLSSKVLYAKPPTYPVDARRAHEQGTVKLLLLVGSDGTVKDIQVAGSSGSQRLDRAALAAVKRWRWSPTMSNGVATAVRGYVTIPFVLV
jgi:protein TonB